MPLLFATDDAKAFLEAFMHRDAQIA